MTATVFITGGSGFVGSDVIRRMPADVHVRVLVRRPRPPLKNIEFVEGDLLDPESYRHALSGVETVVHMAALTGRASAAQFERTNVSGTAALLDVCRSAGVRHFLFVSSIAAAYPDKRAYPYASSKEAAEKIVADSGISFAVLRPTIVLGEGSPILATFLKVARLPITPLPTGAFPVQVQPVAVSDVARAIWTIVQAKRFVGEPFELGGPDALGMEDFIRLLRRHISEQPAAILKVPLAPIRWVLALIEPLARPVLPVTAGQLSLFANHSTSSPNWLWRELVPTMRSVDSIVAELPKSRGRGPGGASSRQPSCNTASSAEDVAEECRAFAKHLAAVPADDLIIRHYAQSLLARQLDVPQNAFEALTLRLARRGGFILRLTDGYCGLLHRRGILRRRLILLLAILEQSPTAHAQVHRSRNEHAILAIARLAAIGLTALASLIASIVVLAPAHVLLARRPVREQSV